MSAMAYQITIVSVVYSTVCLGADQRKHLSSASLTFVWGIHRDLWIPRTKDEWRGKVSIWWRHHVINEIYLPIAFQLYEWSCPSARPSVRHTFLTMFLSSYHHEIFRSYYHWQKRYPSKRSRSKIKGQGHRDQDPMCPFPDCNSN